MAFPLKALNPTVPKPSAHFLRPRKSSHCNPKCFCCGPNFVAADSHAKTGPVALTPPLKPPADQLPSLKFKLSVIKGDNVSLKYEVIKPIPAIPAIPATEGQKRRKDRAEKGPEFTLSLSKKEIEEDFLAMTGAKPPRRPKKRPKRVQKQLDDLFPGVHLSKRVTQAQYIVRHSDLK